MIELGLNNITKYYGATKIFEHISFEVKTGERIGLIGQNGCGKTTIFKILMGLEDYQEGDIHYRKGVKVGYLNQIPVYAEGIKAIDVIRMAFDQTFAIKKQMEDLEHLFSLMETDELDKAMKQYGRLSEQYELAGGYELETKVNKITEGLLISDTIKTMPFHNLSGGEKTRIILAKILLEEPDILLLDEPTNHLDLKTIDWLEDFLKDYKGSVLIVSHDRYFLDRVVNKVVEIEFSKANIYHGSYSYYVAEKERRFLIEYKHYQNQQKKIDRMEQQIKRYRIWGVMRDSDKMFKRAKELEKRLEKMELLGKPVLETKKVRFGNVATNRSGKIVVEIQELSKGFDGIPLIGNININLFYQDSVCIIGENGSGKSTLLKMILGELEQDHGQIKLGSQVKIGYLPQHINFEDEDQTILEYFSRLHDVSYEQARGQLARVLFHQEDVNKKIKFLSGGEKSRLKLCSLTFEKVNFMVLDEPTNHLDINSREVLEETLKEFDGTLLFVSHDRYFINKVADKIIEIADGAMQYYEGDYSYYLEEVKKGYYKEKAENKDENKCQGKDRGRHTEQLPIKIVDNDSLSSKGKSKNEMAQIQKRLEEVEVQIIDYEEQIHILEEKMNQFNHDVIRLDELFQMKVKLENELMDLYKVWDELNL